MCSYLKSNETSTFNCRKLKPDVCRCQAYNILTHKWVLWPSPQLLYKKPLKFNNSSKSPRTSFLIHYGICSIYSPTCAPCFLPPVLKKCTFGPAGSPEWGTNANCHLPATGCYHPFKHSSTTDNARIQSKVLLVLYDVGTIFQLTKIVATGSSC